MKHWQSSLAWFLTIGVLTYGCSKTDDKGSDGMNDSAGKAGGDVAAGGGGRSGVSGGGGRDSDAGSNSAGEPSSSAGSDEVAGAGDAAGGSGDEAGATGDGASGAGNDTGVYGACDSPETHYSHGTVVWKEDFEGDAPDWSITGGVWAVGKPTNANAPKPAAGKQVAGTGLVADYEANKNAFIVSPPISVPAAKNNPRFRYDYWYELAAGDAAYVEIRVDGGGWQALMTLGQSGEGDWRQGFVDLRDYANHSVEIGFRLYTNGSAAAPGFFIDNASYETGAYSFESTQGFEAGWDYWSAAAGVWTLGAPSGADTPKPVEGTALAGAGLTGAYPNNIDAWLESPIIDVPSAKNFPHVSFRYWYELAAGDAGYLMLSLDGGGWQALTTLTGSGDGQWYNLDLPLGAYANRSAQLAFRLYTNGSASSTGFFVDDVHFQTCAPVVNGLQDFEHGWAGWSTYGGVWAVGEPTAADGPKPHSGKSLAGTVLSGDYEPTHDAYFVSPRVVVPKDAVAPQASYWYWYDLAAGDAAYTVVRLDGGGWQALDTLSGSGGDSWRQKKIDLSPYKDHTIELGFRLYTNGAANSTGYYIDDVNFNLK